MSKILHIDSSPAMEFSHSRRLAGEFMKKWAANNPKDEVIYRDLTKNPVPHITEEWVKGLMVPPDQQTPEQKQLYSLSDELISEMLSSERIVISAAMHNFLVPSVLKAYIDHIVRAGKTFRYTETGVEGMLSGIKVLAITSRGGDYREEPMKAFDLQEPWLRTVYGFIGLTDLTFVNLDGTQQYKDAQLETVFKEAGDKLEGLAGSW